MVNGKSSHEGMTHLVSVGFASLPESYLPKMVMVVHFGTLAIIASSVHGILGPFLGMVGHWECCLTRLSHHC